MRAPEQLLEEPYNLRSLKLDGYTVVESCTHQQFSEGDMLVGEHLLLFVLEGRYTASFGEEVFQVDHGEGLLIQRSHVIQYKKKRSDSAMAYKSLMFFLKDEMIKSFLALQSVKATGKSNQPPLSKVSYNHSIHIYLESILASFNNGLSGNQDFLQLKLLELLYNLSEINPNLIQSFSQFTTIQGADLRNVMETHFRQDFTLEEFAYKAGRSLASFKRDFKKIYNISPHQWILSKRLDYAKKLLEHSDLNIADACYEAGFKSVPHFSRAFKNKFSISPSLLKVERIRQAN